jgi:hypothetical protein
MDWGTISSEEVTDECAFEEDENPINDDGWFKSDCFSNHYLRFWMKVVSLLEDARIADSFKRAESFKNLLASLPHELKFLAKALKFDIIAAVSYSNKI